MQTTLFFPLCVTCVTLMVFASGGLAKRDFVPTCFLGCPSGQTQDPRTCRCMGHRCPVPRCPLRFFLRPCAVYKKDSNGCHTCQCECPDSAPCPKNCEFGTIRKTSSDGCETCSCKPQPSVCKLPSDCNLYCFAGYAKDEKGCDICQCSSNVDRCPPLCKNLCPFGRVKDANGCPTCTCKDPTCPPVCEKFCEFGNVVDENGCKICKCKPNPNPAPVKKPCGPICYMYCQFGNVIGPDGCPICKCKLRPDLPQLK